MTAEPAQWQDNTPQSDGVAGEKTPKHTPKPPKVDGDT